MLVHGLQEHGQNEMTAICYVYSCTFLALIHYLFILFLCLIAYPSSTTQLAQWQVN